MSHYRPLRKCTATLSVPWEPADDEPTVQCGKFVHRELEHWNGTLLWTDRNTGAKPHKDDQ